MTKKQVINGAIKLIEKKCNEYGMEAENRGTGKAFEGGFWEHILTDDSNIPNVVAKGKYEEDMKYEIELRSFWGSPEVDVRRETDRGEELLIFNFSDSVKDANGNYIHTGEFLPCEVRVDARGNYYRACIEEVYEMIDFVEAHGVEQEGAAENG